VELSFWVGLGWWEEEGSPKALTVDAFLFFSSFFFFSSTIGRRGELIVWDVSTLQSTKRNLAETRIHCLFAAELRGVWTIMVGCDDQGQFVR
jgi:hypothetical protein